MFQYKEMNIFPYLVAPLGYGFILTLKIEAALTWMNKNEISFFLMILHGFELLGAFIGSTVEFLIDYFDSYDVGYFLVCAVIVISNIVCLVIYLIKPVP